MMRSSSQTAFFLCWRIKQEPCNRCGYRVCVELLGGFEPPTSSLPSDKMPSSRWYIRLCGHFCHKKDEVENSLLHVFRPLVSPCGSRCGSAPSVIRKPAKIQGRRMHTFCATVNKEEILPLSNIQFYANFSVMTAYTTISMFRILFSFMNLQQYNLCFLRRENVRKAVCLNESDGSLAKNQ